MLISLVAAMANNRVIGAKGQMPWHLPAELAYFKKVTTGKPVLMGHRTFNSIGRPLPNRRNLVLSRQPGLNIEGCEVYSSLEAVLQDNQLCSELMIIGGADLFAQALPLAQRMYLTFIDADIPGDTYFPIWEPQDWKEICCQNFTADARNLYNFRTVKLTRLLIPF